MAFNTNNKIALVSFVILLTELALIRIIGSEIRIFAYIQNVVLMVIFIGSGLGMLIKTKVPVLYSVISLAMVALMVNTGVLNIITELLLPLHESYVWYTNVMDKTIYSVFFGILMTTVLLAATSFIFIPIGRVLGDAINENSNLIKAYSLNIIFSLMGILVFNLLSVLGINPYFSILLGLGLLILLVSVKERYISVMIFLAAGVSITIGALTDKSTTWSPYQKLKLVEVQKTRPASPEGYAIHVNNVGYMALYEFGAEYKKEVIETMKADPLTEGLVKYANYLNQYDLPFEFKPNPERVLIIGAGGGNDIAGAVRANAPEIDIVEIDPFIKKLGETYHPEKPYSDSRVNFFIDDGRHFLKQTTKKYDLVIFGLADSHTLSSGMTNVQLDNYLYTREALADVKSVLSDDGVLFLAFEVARPWIGNKLTDIIKHSFGSNFFAFSLKNDYSYFGWGGSYFVAAQDLNTLNSYKDRSNNLEKFVDTRKITFDTPDRPVTDDYPYLYLSKAVIPKIHIIVSGIILALLLVLLKKTGIQGGFRWDAFFMGAGFLLFEFQNISKSALIYGNTWKTNVYTISAILSLILVANFIASKIRLNIKLLYALLVISFLIQLQIDPTKLIGLPEIIKVYILPFALNVPLLFSGLIFIRLFEESIEKSAFFAANLIGSSVGGVLSYTSYLYGLKSLLFISLVCYLVSLVFVILGTSLLNSKKMERADI